jgi:hypothetical protein
MGYIRRSAESPASWPYRGELVLPAGRACSLEARVAEDASGKFFEIRAGLIPGMNAAELESALVEEERLIAERIVREGRALADLPDDELPF